jgi:O-antigen/teichoic acid export membrane protein
LALPYFFVRIFRPAEFSLWVLVLQLAAYVNFLNFGVQTAIGRFVAHSLGRGRNEEAEEIVGAGLQILTALAALGIVIVSITALLLPVVFKRIDPSLVDTGRMMLLCIGGALALGLPFTSYLGVFVGLQRNDIPAVIALISKGALALGLVIVAKQTRSLRSVSEAYFVLSMIGYGLQYVFFKRVCPGWRIGVLSSRPAARRELLSYCASLTVWSVSMLLVTGLDTTIVGIFDFKSVAAYGISASIVAFFIGTFRSIVSPVLQVFAKFHAQNKETALLSLLRASSSLISILLIVSACWMILPAGLLFRLWVGPGIAGLAVRIFTILIFANAIRNSAAPYANYLVAVGLQRAVYLSPLAEGISNLLASVGLAILIGGIGVAWGTVVGAIIGVAANFLYNLRRTTPPEFSIRHFFNENITVPLLASFPMFLVLAWTAKVHIPLVAAAGLMAIASLPSMFVARKLYKDITKRRQTADLIAI